MLVSFLLLCEISLGYKTGLRHLCRIDPCFLQRCFFIWRRRPSQYCSEWISVRLIGLQIKINFTATEQW